MPAQGELRGPKADEARKGGGDWDANASDFVIWVEPAPGDRCHALLVRDHSLLPGEPYPAELENSIGRLCTNVAPIGSSLCTPCHRRRIRSRYRRLSLEHRVRISAQTGRPVEEIQ